jgi:hypothetical protein
MSDAAPIPGDDRPAERNGREDRPRLQEGDEVWCPDRGNVGTIEEVRGDRALVGFWNRQTDATGERWFSLSRLVPAAERPDRNTGPTLPAPHASPPRECRRAAADPPFDDRRSARLVRRAATGKGTADVDLKRLAPEWAEAVLLAEQDGADGIEAWLNALESRDPGRVEACRAALAEAESDPTGDGDDAGRNSRRIEYIDSPTFARGHYPLNWYIEDVIVEGMPAGVGAQQKTLKTTTMTDQALSLGTGTPFLGRFRVVEPVRVGFLSVESGRAVIQETARRICRSKGVELADANVYWLFEPVNLGDPADLHELQRIVRGEGIKVFYVDPLYLCLTGTGRDIDASNVFDVGPILRRAGDAFLEAGSTPVYVHHFKKTLDDPFGVPSLTDFSYSAVPIYLRQWQLLNRRRPYDASGVDLLHYVVGGSAGQAGVFELDIEQGVQNATFDGRYWKVGVASAPEARSGRAERRLIEQVERQGERDRERAERSSRRKLDAANQLIKDAELIVKRLQELGGLATPKKVRDRLPWNSERFRRGLAVALNLKSVEETTTTVPAGRGARPVPALRLVGREGCISSEG